LSQIFIEEKKEKKLGECSHKKACPYLNFERASSVLAQRDYLIRRVDEMERIMDLAREKIEKLREENKVLRKEKESLKQELAKSYCKKFKPNLKEETEEMPKKKKGAPFGHPGTSRKRPKRIDEYVDIYPLQCDRCGTEDITIYAESFEEHIIEDIKIRVKNTCYRSHYGYCKRCRKVIYPKEKMRIIPNSRIGSNARAICGYLRYMGLPFRKVAKISKDIFGLEITHPSLLDFDTKIAKNGESLYERIKDEVRSSSSINADETGWKVNGENFWLWNFVNGEVALFRIEAKRAAEIVRDTLGEEYDGILGSDFYSAYNNNIKAKGKQKCLAHLLREVKEIEKKNEFDTGSQEELLCQKLKEALKGAIKTWNEFHQGKKSTKDLKAAKEIAAQKLIEVISSPQENKDITRLKKRIIKHEGELLTFLDHPEIEPTNNKAERALRASVIMRKITFGNRSATGARNHQVIMSILQTASLHHIEPFSIFLSLANKKDRLIVLEEELVSSADKEPKRIRAP